MSKIARKPIEIPDNIKMTLNGNVVDVEGPAGKLSFEKNENIDIDIQDGIAKVISNVP